MVVLLICSALVHGDRLCSHDPLFSNPLFAFVLKQLRAALSLLVRGGDRDSDSLFPVC